MKAILRSIMCILQYLIGGEKCSKEEKQWQYGLRHGCIEVARIRHA